MYHPPFINFLSITVKPVLLRDHPSGLLIQVVSSLRVSCWKCWKPQGQIALYASNMLIVFHENRTVLKMESKEVEETY